MVQNGLFLVQKIIFVFLDMRYNKNIEIVL